MMHFWPHHAQPTLTLGIYGPPLVGQRFVLGPAEVASHKHVIGLTGQGKSKLIVSIFLQLLNQGISCALVDPHADLAADCLHALLDSGYFRQPDAYKKLLYVDFSRQDAFLPFNVLSQPYDIHTVARNMVEVCKRAWSSLSDGAAPQFENIMLSAVVVLVANQLSLTALPRLLTDKGYRDELLRSVADPQVVHFFHARYDHWGKDQPLMIESTLRRVFLLTFSPTLRYCLGQRENTLNFRRLMDEGTSVIFNLGGLDEETQRFLGCLLTVGFEVASLSRADIPEEQRSQYHFLLDEFSMFSAQSEESLARVLSLCRKYGLFLTLAHQTWSQVSQRLQGALQNTVSIAFKLGRSDAQWAAPRFGHFDPYVVKHIVEDPDQVERTHPVYFNLQETHEGWTKALEQLNPREAFVRVGKRTAKIRTLTVRPPTHSREELKQLMEHYAKALLIPREQVVSQVDAVVEREASRPISRKVLLEDEDDEE
jgi:hypothetical protein